MNRKYMMKEGIGRANMTIVCNEYFHHNKLSETEHRAKKIHRKRERERKRKGEKQRDKETEKQRERWKTKSGSEKIASYFSSCPR